MWYWICGTPFEDGSGHTRPEYTLTIFAIAFIGIMAYTNALCYPRNFYQQFFVLGEFPKYYKIHHPKALIKNVQGDRIGADGKKEYKVTLQSVSKPREEYTLWKKKSELVLDGAGQVYGERGGLYGVLHDTYQGSTRDRLRTYDAYKHAVERLKLYEDKGSRSRVAGIAYSSGLAKPAAKTD